MTITSGTFIVMLCSLLTGLIVEAFKNMTKVKKPNILAAIVSVVVGAFVSISYIWLSHLAFDGTALMFIVSIVVLSWLCSMLGFDKVMQTLSQLKR